MPVSFTSLHTSIATVDANGTITIVGPGVATIRATQDGNASYNPAQSVEKTLTVNKVSQTITFGALSDASLNTGTYSLSGKATASSGLAVGFSNSDSSVATLSGTTLTLLKGGTVTITASQSGDDTYLAAPSVTQSLTIKDDRYVDQNITWTQTISSLTFGAADLNLTARSIDAVTGADTNLTISYASSDPSVVTVVNGNALQIAGAGTAVVTATQTGNVDSGGVYNAATPVTKNISVGKAGQEIVTNSGSSTLPDLTKDNGDFEFAPALKSVKQGTTTSTGLALSYTSSNSAVVSITSGGSKLTPSGPGTATITVSQPGDTSYDAATSKTFSVTVTEKSPYSDSFSTLHLWLDGKDINGDQLPEDSNSFLSGISAWSDRSGKSNTMSQGTAANQASYISNGGGLSFDGTNDFMSTAMPADFAGNPGLTLLVVGDSSGTTDKRLVQIGDNYYGSAKIIGFSTNGGLAYANNGSLSGNYDYTSASTIAVWRRKSTDHTGQADFFRNGEKKGLTASSSVSLSLPSSGSSILLAKGQGGSGWSSAQYFGGKIREVMLFTDDLSDYAIKRGLKDTWLINGELSQACQIVIRSSQLPRTLVAPRPL